MNIKQLYRFRARYVIYGKTNCWLWQGGPGFSLNGKVRGVHLVSYEHFKHDLPARARVVRVCEYVNCVNPNHLKLARDREPLGMANAKKTHCNRGHRLAGENLEIRPSGFRGCRECSRLRAQASRDRKKAERLVT